MRTSFNKSSYVTFIITCLMIMLLSCNNDGSSVQHKHQKIILDIDTLYVIYPGRDAYGDAIIQMMIDNSLQLIKYPRQCSYRVYIDSIDYSATVAYDSTHIRLRLHHLNLPRDSSEAPLIEEYIKSHVFVVIKDTCCSRTKYYLAQPQ